MLDSVADLLHSLVSRALPDLDKESRTLGHPGLIGDMYEGLTRNALQRAVFEGLDLHLVSGKIENSDGKVSRQIDCMLVVGEGRPVPYTQHRVCHVRDVVAVVEVKKNLFYKDLKDSCELFVDLLKAVCEPTPVEGKLLRHAWTQLMGKHLPETAEVLARDDESSLLYSALAVRANAPVRIVLGYSGYASERALRQGFIKYIGDKVGEKSAGVTPPYFPSLVVCREACLLMCDGMPFGSRVAPDGTWPCMASRGREPFRILLEYIWARLSYRFHLDSSMFGEDLRIDAVTRLLDARPDAARHAWAFDYYDPAEKVLADRRDDDGQWEPCFVSQAEFVIVNMLCARESLSLNDESLAALATEHETTVEDLCDSLQRQRIAAPEGGRLYLLTDECACVILPDGRYAVGENASGRLERWVAKRVGGAEA